MPINSIIKAGHCAPSADNSQPWCFRVKDNEVSVGYATERLAGGTFGPTEPATLIAMGGVLENMLQAAASLGVSANYSLGGDTAGRDGNSYFTLTLGNGRGQPGLCSDFGEHALFKRHTNRFPYKAEAIPTEIVAEVDKLREGGSFIKTLDDLDNIKAIAAIAKQASEVRFQTQEVHEWLARSLRYTQQEAARGDGLDLATLPLPPGGGVFMRYLMDWKWMSRLNRLGAYKLMAAMDVKLLENAPAVLAIVGGATFAEVIEAGRLLQRIWMVLNAAGIAMQPYYVVSDQLQRRLDGKVPFHLLDQIDGVAEQTANLLKLSEHQRLHMLLRIGFPTKNPVRSKRLPVQVVCQ